MTRHLRIYDHFVIPHLSNTAAAWRPGRNWCPGTWTKQLGLQRVPHAGRLFRTRAACPVHGRGCPDSEQQAHVRMRRPHQSTQSTQSTNPSNTTRPITPHVDLLDWKAPLDLLGLRDPAGPRDRPLRAAGSRRAYCRSDSSRFARTTMPMRSTIASSTQLPSSAARRGCTGASSKRRSKPRIARHRGMSSSW